MNMNQVTLWRLTNTIKSLSDSTFIRVRVPFGPVVEVNGRNGNRPVWRVGSMSIPDKLDTFFLADNGRYSLIFSPYYYLNLDPSEGQIDTGLELVEGILPASTVVPIFRKVREAFLLFSDQTLLDKFLPTETVRIYTIRPYKSILPDFL